MPNTTSINRVDHSASWAFQTKVSFVLSLTGLVIGIWFLPVQPWARAYLACVSLYSITSAINLSKAIRDEHESSRITTRVDEAKLDRILAEHDPFKVA